MFRRKKFLLMCVALSACFVFLWKLLYGSGPVSHRVIHTGPWDIRTLREDPKVIPRLVWHFSENSHPYFLSPILQFENDTQRRRSKFNLTGVDSLYSAAETTEKLIVFYNLPSWHTFDSRYKNSLQHCRVQSCKMSANRTLLPKADGVIFYVLDILEDTQPPPKPANQMWVFFTHEPAFDFPRWQNLFNWTMTYRFDSDVVCPYFLIVPKPTPDVRNFKSIAAKKTSQAAWMVTRCDARSKRDSYVRELQKYINVDIYGGCGPLKCPRSDQDKCDEMLNKKYKFYLAFENSLCRGYLTEKVFRCYTLDIIPVVRGGARYDDLIPRGSYINTADFSSPAHLADYLTYLDNNDTAYAEILEKKSQYTVTDPDSTLNSSLCDICVKLHDLDRFANTYYDINKWWNKDVCVEATDV